jgi:MoxR-like ATPase
MNRRDAWPRRHGPAFATLAAISAYPRSPVGPYESPEQHLADQIDVASLVLAIAAMRRRPAMQRTDPDADPELGRAVAALQSKEAAIEARVQHTDPALLPLERLRRTFGLSATEVRVIAMLAAFELETPLRDQARALMADPNRIHPDVGLLIELVYTGRDRKRVAEELASDGRLIRFALVRVERVSDTPFALRRARVVERVLELLHGRDALDREVARHVELMPPLRRDALVIDQTRFDEVAGLVAASLAAGQAGRPHPVIMLSGQEGAGRKSLLAAAATASGLAALRVRCTSFAKEEAWVRQLGPSILREAILWRALIVLDGLDQFTLDNVSVRLDEALFGGFVGPVAAVLGRITGKPPQMARGQVVIEVAIPSEIEREELWRRALRDVTTGDVIRSAAERYTITPGVLLQAAESARARAGARGRSGGDRKVIGEDIHAGLRGALDAKLATLGLRITWRQTWADLVLPDDNVAEIREFIARVKHRRTVYERWGFGRKVAKGLGLSALFSGPPGTGKTMVAGLIAEELKLDLYQVDLSKVTSKWIGETEKNLAELFDAAESGHAILLFDEADSLFAKRTEVKSSVDRYANLEVNYLLQRMESFAGITILTTNNDAAIDEAFRRRLSLKVDFPVPELEERLRLWRTMLPAEAAVATDIDFDTLADKYEMTGGYIKNAALRAAFLAADEGVPIAMRHLTRAARSEYQAMGKVISHM